MKQWWRQLKSFIGKFTARAPRTPTTMNVQTLSPQRHNNNFRILVSQFAFCECFLIFRVEPLFHCCFRHRSCRSSSWQCGYLKTIPLVCLLQTAIWDFKNENTIIPLASFHSAAKNRKNPPDILWQIQTKDWEGKRFDKEVSVIPLAPRGGKAAEDDRNSIYRGIASCKLIN